MFNILYTELLKLKRRKILFLSPVCALITAIFGYMKWCNVRQIYGDAVDWTYLFPMTEEIATSSLLIVIIICFSAFVFLMEYQNSCSNMLYSYSHKSYRFIIAKLFISFGACIITVFITFAVIYILGVVTLLQFPYNFVLTFHIKTFLIMAVLCFALAPLYIFLAVVSRGYILPLATVVLVNIWDSSLSEIIKFRFNADIGFLPWMVPNSIIQSLQPDLNSAYKLTRISDYTPYLFSISVTFFIPLILLIIYFVKTQHARTN